MADLVTYIEERSWGRSKCASHFGQFSVPVEVVTQIIELELDLWKCKLLPAIWVAIWFSGVSGWVFFFGNKPIVEKPR